MANKRRKHPDDLAYKRGGRYKPMTQLDASLVEFDDTPPPPDGLSAFANERWRVLWSSPVARLLNLDVHGVALTHLFQLIDKRHALWREWETTGPLVRLASGTVVVNPTWRVIRDLDAEIAHYEEQFGLTPLAQLRLGVEFLQGQKLVKGLNEPIAGERRRPTLVRLDEASA